MKKRSILRIFALVLAVMLTGLSFPAEAAQDYSLWKQTDPRWGQEEIWPEETYPEARVRTLAEGGGALTSLAMLLRQYKIVTDDSFTPLQCARQLEEAQAFGQDGQLLWFRIQEAFPGFQFENRVEFTLRKLTALIDYGHPCILERKGKDGSPTYCAVQSVTPYAVNIMDPGSQTAKLTDPYDIQAIHYFTIRSPEDHTPEYAKYPAPVMEITQLAYENYSHVISNAIDIIPHGELIAPFRCTVTFTDPSWGYVVLQSTGKVLFADGTQDYMTVSFVHSEDIGEMIRAQKSNRIICQGEPIYHAGGMGRWNPNAYREHVHVAAYRGHVSGVTDDGYYGCGDVYPFDAFFIDPEFTTGYNGRGEGYKSTDGFMYNKAPDDYRGRWKTADFSQEPDPPAKAPTKP